MGTFDATAERIMLSNPNDDIELRQLVPEDAEAYFALVEQDRDHLNQFERTADAYPTLDAVRDSILYPQNHQKTEFGIRHEEVLVGVSNIRVGDGVGVLGSFIGKFYTGNYYAARSVRLLIDYAFERLELSKLFGDIVVGNEASRKTAERSGFQFQSTEGNMWIYVLANPKKGTT